MYPQKKDKIERQMKIVSCWRSPPARSPAVIAAYGEERSKIARRQAVVYTDLQRRFKNPSKTGNAL